MAKSMFQPKSQAAKKAAARQQRVDLKVETKTAAGATWIKKQPGADTTAQIKDTGKPASESTIKVMPIDTNGIGFKTMRLSFDPISATPAARTDKNVAPLKNSTPSAGVNVSQPITVKSVAATMPHHVELIEAPAPKRSAWANTVGLTKVKSAEKLTSALITPPTAPDRIPEPVSLVVTATEFPALAAPTAPQPNPPRIQPLGKNNNEWTTVGAVKITKKNAEQKKLKKASKVSTLPVLEQKLDDVSGSKIVHEDTPTSVAQATAKSDEAPKSQDPTGQKANTGPLASEPNVDIGDTAAPSTVPSLAAKKSNKKSGAAQKKAKAARHRATAEAYLDDAFSTTVLSAAKVPQSKDINKLKQLAACKPSLEEAQQLLRTRLIDLLVWAQSKNIDIAEVAKSSCILQDKNGKFLSGPDQEKTIELCKEYKAYQDACNALAMAQVTERALAEAEAAQRMFGVASLATVSKASQKRKARRPSPTLPTPTSSGGLFASGFDFKVSDDAPKFDEMTPVAVPEKMEFSTTVFNKPSTAPEEVPTSPLKSKDVAVAESITVIPEADKVNEDVSIEQPAIVTPEADKDSNLVALGGISATWVDDTTPEKTKVSMPEFEDAPAEEPVIVTPEVDRDADTVTPGGTSVTQVDDMTSPEIEDAPIEEPVIVTPEADKEREDAPIEQSVIATPEADKDSETVAPDGTSATQMDDTTPEMTEVSPSASPTNQHAYPEDTSQALAEAVEAAFHFMNPPTTKVKATEDATISQRCRAMEIGIYNLDDYFTELGDSSPIKSSKVQVVTAFTKLSSQEREALDLGAVHVAHATTILVNKRLQHKIKLGSIKLVDFLGCIEFGENDEATHLGIAKAFEECAQKDAAAGVVDSRLLEVGREMGWGVKTV
ncbi:hypothetical protein N0V83_003611 [Neocucurbitaria cava]|uniref:Uncharacterized protein n=1 Tax=Neocucurbitaria cava TaxID=798079 RepID=A0A9W8YC24_9PLEO|nr:hypothetical protein N0V83_003611 [Neocucurbitaria cava]